LLLLVLVLFNQLGVRRAIPYLLVGGLVWLAMLESGVHATVAGILVALTVPARPRHGPSWFLRRTRRLVDEFEQLEQDKPAQEVSQDSILAKGKQHTVVERVRETAKESTTPLQIWERTLETPVTLLVLPVFALANSGVPIKLSQFPLLLTEPMALGVVLGLLLGKVVGISGFCWLALKSGLGELPEGMRMKHVVGIGVLGGMGFTMSIFIAGLGFDDDPRYLLIAKGAILLVSLLAGIGGYLWLRLIATEEESAAKDG